MIPKKLHLIWIGKAKPALPYLNKIKRIYNDYEIKIWRDKDFDFSNSNDFVKLALKEKKYSFVTDYLRMQILFEEGGVYLDTDMDPLIKIDETDLKEKEIICGYEYRFNVTMGFIAMVKGHKFSKEIMDYYDSLMNCGFKPLGNLVWTEFLYKLYPSLSKSNKTKEIHDLKIFNSNAFALWKENKKASYFIHRHEIYWIKSKNIRGAIKIMAKFAKLSPAFPHYIMVAWNKFQTHIKSQKKNKGSKKYYELKKMNFDYSGKTRIETKINYKNKNTRLKI